MKNFILVNIIRTFAKIQGANEALANTFQVDNNMAAVQLFCDGSNWYRIN